MKYSNSKYKISVFLVFVLLNSCIGYKKTLYFQGDQTTIDPPALNETYLLRKGDMIKIDITTPDTESLTVLKNETSSTTSVTQPYFTSYYINDSGYVDLSLIGKVRVAGLTIIQTDSVITALAKKYINYATVDVKLASFKFLALGEFTTPGQYYVGNETCTIYEALAIAGDATMYANKQKVQLIRTNPQGTKKIYHLNITDYSSFTSETFYIQPNDILYIQPQKAKVDKQNIAYVSLGVSLFAVITLIISRF